MAEGSLSISAWVFWLSASAVAYAYVGYPCLVWLVARRRPRFVVREGDDGEWPAVTMLVPVHNERGSIDAKLANTRALRYPGRLRALFVSDGSTDGTVERLEGARNDRVDVLVLPERRGKAAALNLGLSHAAEGIVVFSDASIMLLPDAIVEVVRPFQDPAVGCVSGEDRIAGTGGEGLYGRYEMFIRRQESRLHSIVGASGSFYAQRRELCAPFVPNLAPDFLSVLRTVKSGYRAISEPRAVGVMRAVDDPRQEFQRKVRTILRGLTTLGANMALLNPFRTGVFAFELLSHKLMRWLVPFFLAAMLLASGWLGRSSPGYAILFGLQLAFHVLAWAGLTNRHPRALDAPARVAAYFTSANLAALMAWLRYLQGDRQEVWSPSKR